MLSNQLDTGKRTYYRAAIRRAAAKPATRSKSPAWLGWLLVALAFVCVLALGRLSHAEPNAIAVLGGLHSRTEPGTVALAVVGVLTLAALARRARVRRAALRPCGEEATQRSDHALARDLARDLSVVLPFVWPLIVGGVLLFVVSFALLCAPPAGAETLRVGSIECVEIGEVLTCSDGHNARPLRPGLSIVGDRVPSRRTIPRYLWEPTPKPPPRVPPPIEIRTAPIVVEIHDDRHRYGDRYGYRHGNRGRPHGVHAGSRYLAPTPTPQAFPRGIPPAPNGGRERPQQRER